MDSSYVEKLLVHRTYIFVIIICTVYNNRRVVSLTACYSLIHYGLLLRWRLAYSYHYGN